MYVDGHGQKQVEIGGYREIYVEELGKQQSETLTKRN